MLISHNYNLNTVRETFVVLHNLSSVYVQCTSFQCGLDLTDTLSNNSDTI